MPSRREQIRMSEQELQDFLHDQKVMTCATIGPEGRPHLMPLWYVVDGPELRGWTYAKSQKTKNLERDPRATVQVETGVRYDQLRGVMMECDVEVVRETDRVAEHGMELFRRYAGGPDGVLPDGVEEMVAAQAPKRVGLRFTPTRIVSWDHGKLGGAY
jgi:PPOX class probable F420-dependent enzyme